MKRDVLLRRFAPAQVRQRPGQHGKVLSYIPTHLVVERLDEAAEDCWQLQVESFEVHDLEVLVLARLTLDGTTMMAFGSAAIAFDENGVPKNLGDSLKAAQSNALRKAASYFGIGAYLAKDENNAEAPQEDRHPQASDFQGPRLTTRQLAAIHAASRRQGLSRERLAHFLESEVGKADVNALTKAEASNVISALSGANGSGH